MLVQKFQIDKKIVQESYKKANFSRNLSHACNASDIKRVKAILNEMKDEYKRADVSDVFNIAIFDTERSNHFNVKFDCIIYAQQ